MCNRRRWTGSYLRDELVSIGQKYIPILPCMTSRFDGSSMMDDLILCAQYRASYIANIQIDWKESLQTVHCLNVVANTNSPLFRCANCGLNVSVWKHDASFASPFFLAAYKNCTICPSSVKNHKAKTNFVQLSKQ